MCQWQSEGEHRSAGGCVADCHGAAVGSHYLRDDGQAEARSPRRAGAGGVEANEPLEDAVAVRAGMPGPSSAILTTA